MTRIINILLLLHLINSFDCKSNEKQHYYFDKVERKYHHLDNTLSQAEKQFLNEKIEAEIAWVKRGAAANNIALLLTTTFSVANAITAINMRSQRINRWQGINRNGFILRAFVSAMFAIRCYTYDDEINTKIAKLIFKQSLLKK